MRRGLARSRDEAQELIAAGLVRVAGQVATKAATAVEPATPVLVDQAAEDRWVSRGAHKLLGALDVFGLDPTGLRALDAGASTGGFTEVLLRRGARHVVAADVGYGLLAPARFHPSWLLEALLPGFKWLSLASFVLGLIESVLYATWAGVLFSALYNYFSRRADRDAERRVITARAA